MQLDQQAPSVDQIDGTTRCARCGLQRRDHWGLKPRADGYCRGFEPAGPSFPPALLATAAGRAAIQIIDQARHEGREVHAWLPGTDVRFEFATESYAQRDDALRRLRGAGFAAKVVAQPEVEKQS